MSGRLWWWLSWLGELGKWCQQSGSVWYMWESRWIIASKRSPPTKRDHSIWSKSEIIPTITLRSCFWGVSCVVSRVCGEPNYSVVFMVLSSPAGSHSLMMGTKSDFNNMPLTLTHDDRQCSKFPSWIDPRPGPDSEITSMHSIGTFQTKEIMFIKCPVRVRVAVCVRMW